ncbi:MAG: RecQ family ATP-dependent DNA helicase [Candidatus Marinimicrobia bacterium]|nr:RecQ family ATP-dependent DNA helicase [Candidatus Neomarinimicrobiota bacterium]
MVPEYILKTRFELSQFRPGQREIIDHLLNGQSVIVTMPTGSGKSLCYQLPALMIEGVTLVVSPLIALMKDQVDTLKQLNIPATFINSTISWKETLKRFSEIKNGEIHLVYIAPERFYSNSFLQLIKSVEVSLFVVDEAHCISQWGHDFRPSYLRLKDAIYTVGNPPVGAFTATATLDVQRDIRTQLGLTDAAEIITGFDRPNLKYVALYLKNDKEKEKELLRILPTVQGSGILYVGTKKLVASLTNLLKLEGYSVTGYHGGMEKAEREQAQNDWISGKTSNIVATNAFGMGIDKPDVRFVFHYTMPGTVEAYYQESGRAGRDGITAYCVSFSSYSDVRLQEFFIDNAHPPREVIIDIYNFLFSLNRQDIFLTHREIAEKTGSGIKEMMVGSALAIMERAGLIKRLSRSDHLMEIEFLPETNTLKKIKHDTQQGILLDELMKRVPDPDSPVIRILPETLTQATGLTRAQLSTTLMNLGKKSLIGYLPPFRGRGVRLTSQRMPASKLTIDFEAIEKHRDYQLKQLAKMRKYYSIRRCRRNYLLEYFGESPHSKNCRGCDVCLNWISPGKSEAREHSFRAKSFVQPEVKDLALDILNFVQDVDGEFGSGALAKTLAGSQSERLSLKLKTSLWYGKYEQFTRKFISKVLDKMEKQGYFHRTSGLYPALLLSGKGKDVLSGNRSMVDLKIDQVTGKAYATASTMPANGPRLDGAQKPYDRKLYELLKHLRSTLANGKPAYTVFSDRILKEMCRYYPSTSAEFGALTGIGPVKLRKYGGSFTGIIKQYLAENPDAVKDKKHSKILSESLHESWSYYKAGLGLQEIAAKRGLKESTIVNHLCQLASFGKTIDTERFLPKGKIWIIQKAIRQSKIESLSAIKDTLCDHFSRGDTISYDEIRLVLSCVGNTTRDS